MGHFNLSHSKNNFKTLNGWSFNNEKLYNSLSVSDRIKMKKLLKVELRKPLHLRNEFTFLLRNLRNGENYRTPQERRVLKRLEGLTLYNNA